MNHESRSFGKKNKSKKSRNKLLVNLDKQIKLSPLYSSLASAAAGVADSSSSADDEDSAAAQNKRVATIDAHSPPESQLTSNQTLFESQKQGKNSYAASHQLFAVPANHRSYAASSASNSSCVHRKQAARHDEEVSRRKRDVESEDGDDNEGGAWVDDDDDDESDNRQISPQSSNIVSSPSSDEDDEDDVEDDDPNSNQSEASDEHKTHVDSNGRRAMPSGPSSYELVPDEFSVFAG